MPAKTRRAPQGWWGRALLGLNALALVPVGLSAAAPLVPAHPWWPMALTALLMPWWALLPLAGGALWWRRSWLGVGLNALALVALVPSLSGHVQFNTAAEPGPREFTLLSLNSKALDYDARQLPALEALLAREQADVVLLQEYFTGYARGEDRFIERLKRAGGYRYGEVVLLVPDNFGLAMLSKYPLSNVRRLTRRKGPDTNGTMAADIEVYGQRIRLYNVHLQSYKLSQTQRTVLDSLAGASVEARTMRSTLGRMRQSWRRQRAQVEQIMADAADTEHPSLVAGDLNNPPTSWAVAALGRGRTDSFVARGWGLGHTFGRGVSAFRIDYVLAPPALEVRAHRLVETTVSDHRGVLVRLRVRGTAQRDSE